MTVQMMARIIENTETHGLDRMQDIEWDPHTTSGVITKAAAEVGQRIDAKFLVAFTHSGEPPAGCPGCGRPSRCWPSPRTSRPRLRSP